MQVTETSPPRNRCHRVFVAAFLVTLLYVLLSQHLLPSGDNWGLRAGPFADVFATLDEAETPASTGFVLASRRLKQRLEDFERRLEEESHLRAMALPNVQVLLAAAGGVGNESVYLGQDDWLILRAGFDYLTGPQFLDPRRLELRRRDAPAWQPAPRPDPRPAILDFHRQLAARGIRLLLLPAPTKPMIHPESLRAGLADSAATTYSLQNPSFDAFRTELEAQGVEIFDPAPTLLANLRETGRKQYLRTDSHWTPVGVDAVAFPAAHP